MNVDMQNIFITFLKNPYIKLIVGRKNYNQMKELYKKFNYLLFSSKLRNMGSATFRAVISCNLPILASDLNYVRETVGNYNKILYFDPDDHNILSKIIYKIVTKKK